MTSLVAVFNPHARRGEAARAWRELAGRLRQAGVQLVELETHGHGADAQRIAEAVRQAGASRVIAAGGDGTVRDVAEAIASFEPAAAPSLAFAPIGTANNAARAFGLQSCRAGRSAAFDLAVQAALSGAERRVDLGRVNGRIFAGSVALGMDADILAMRNLLCRRAPRALAGYPLYLWCCAVNFLRGHGARAVLAGDETGVLHVYNLLVTNTPIYAGEFRFADGECFADGRLDLLIAENAGQYGRSYPAAWPRHLRARAGRAVRPDRRLRRFVRLTVDFEQEVAWQVDGEEMPATRRFQIEALPGAISVCTPSLASPPAPRGRSAG